MKRMEVIYSLEDIHETASELIHQFADKRIFLFSGNLGSGKTTLVRAICEELGCHEQVSSPTFSLINEYKAGNLILYHFDLYRLNTLEEALDTGLEEYLYSGNYCFVEWPEKITGILPGSLAVRCELNDFGNNKRKLTASAS